MRNEATNLVSKVLLTEKQKEAQALANSPASNILFRGGSGSGKTFLIIYLIITRALSAPNSRHAIFRHTQTSCRSTLFELTFKEVIRAMFPNEPSIFDDNFGLMKINKTEMTVTFFNGSVLLFGGLDDTNRIEKILGQSFATAYINEASEINDFGTVELIQSRFRSQAATKKGVMSAKLYIDCNPTSIKHWTYKAFKLGLNPSSGKPHRRPEKWAEIAVNPYDNRENLTEDYLETLADFSADKRKRFLFGEWQTDNQDAMFQPDWINDNRSNQPDHYKKIVVSIDPAVSSNKKSDETGIIVVGQDENDHCYLLEDGSGKYTPTQWASKAIELYHKYQANLIIAEKNQGGEMVGTTLETVDQTVAFKLIHAQRSKAIRAEPVAALYEKGLIHHVYSADLEKLEEQLEEFDGGRKGSSPDRVDALVHAITELCLLKVAGKSGNQKVLLGLFGK